MIELTASEGLLDELQDMLSKNPGIERVLVSRRTLHNALTSVLNGEIDPVQTPSAPKAGFDAAV